jgi:hypothetical protein
MWLKSIYQFHKSFTKVIEKSWLWSYEAVLVEIIWGCPGWDHIRLSWLRSYEACPGWDHKRLSWWRSYEACPGWDHMRLVLAEIAWGCPGGDHMRLVLAEITRGCPGGDHMRLVLAEIAWGCPGGNHMRLVLAEIMWSLDIHVHLPMLSVSIARVGSLILVCDEVNMTQLYMFSFVSNFNVDTEILSNLVSSILR